MSEPEAGATETIGQRLKRLRLDRGLSQRELSGPGVSYAYISRIEAGTRQPSVKALRLLARKLGCSPEYLETGSELGAGEERELRLADAELELRIGHDLDEARRRILAILEDAATDGDVETAMRAQVALGIAAYNGGETPEAIVRLEAAVRAGVSVTAQPDVFDALARSYTLVGTPDRAVDLLSGCLEEIEHQAAADTALRVRVATALSNALISTGDVAGGNEVLVNALRHAEEAEADPYARVRLHWTLARVAEIAGHNSTALAHMRRAIAVLEVTEETIGLSRAHANCAHVLITQGKALQAGPHLEMAANLLGPSPMPIDLANLRIEESRRATQLGRPEDGIERAREALTIAGRDNPRFSGAAWVALAQALAQLGRTDEAAGAYAEGFQLLSENGDPLAAAVAGREWGKLLRATGREAEALDVLERAAELAVRIRPSSEARLER